ncbi:nitroreductase [Salinisphaera sp. Q1T1-3]|uniref:nitroreductase family protein n=1 Tax=Salinisphaera sp. Q1T1-3 TaxID=2321229 RepID=UPI001F470E4F|nr:nitroreductase [Salinisphaera sp. Q1T1-3]
MSESPVSPVDVATLIKGRRTVDHFVAGEVPPRETIIAAIDAARWAPNHHLTQPWRFSLLGPKAQQAVVALNTGLLQASRGAEVAEAKRERWSQMPGWLVVTCEKTNETQRAAEDYAACACAIQNLSLYLHAAGIGTKWASGAITREPDFLEIAGADPAREYAVGLIWYGYPKRRPRSQRVALETIIRKCE